MQFSRNRINPVVKPERRSKFFTPTGSYPGLDPGNQLASTGMIISFTLPPTPYSISYSGVDVSEGEDFYMNDDLEAENATITTPGEFITSARTFMRSSSCDPVSLRMTVSRGHGTYADNDEAVASVAGTIERVNNLVTVRALHTRYPKFES